MISASGLAPNCGYAKVLSEKRPRAATTIEAADRGTVFHKAVETWLKAGELPAVDDLEISGWLDLLASQWIPPEGVHAETAWGLRPDGSYVDVREPEPHKYVAVDGSPLLTAGRADLDWLDRFDGWLLTNVDLKTGKWPVTPAASNLQVNAGAIALAQLRNARGYVPAVYYVRDGAWDIGDPVLLGSPDWAAQLEAVRAAATLPPEPMPGPWCARCWERKACPKAAS